MSDHPVRDWIYEWIVGLAIVWVLLAAVVYATASWALHRPAPHQPSTLINSSDVDQPSQR